jgi:hypothetical protein
MLMGIILLTHKPLHIMTAVEIISISINSLIALALIVNGIYQNGKMKSMEKFVNLINVEDFEKYVNLKMKTVELESEEKIKQIERVTDTFKEEVNKASNSNEELKKKINQLMKRQEGDLVNWSNSVIQTKIVTDFIAKCIQEGKIDLETVDVYMQKVKEFWEPFVGRNELEKLRMEMITVKIPTPDDVLRGYVVE